MTKADDEINLKAVLVYGVATARRRDFVIGVTDDNACHELYVQGRMDAETTGPPKNSLVYQWVKVNQEVTLRARIPKGAKYQPLYLCAANGEFDDPATQVLAVQPIEAQSANKPQVLTIDAAKVNRIDAARGLGFFQYRDGLPEPGKIPKKETNRVKQSLEKLRQNQANRPQPYRIRIRMPISTTDVAPAAAGAALVRGSHEWVLRTPNADVPVEIEPRPVSFAPSAAGFRLVYDGEGKIAIQRAAGGLSSHEIPRREEETSRLMQQYTVEGRVTAPPPAINANGNPDDLEDDNDAPN